MQSSVWGHKFSAHCSSILILCFISHKQKHSVLTNRFPERISTDFQSAPVQNGKGLTFVLFLSRKFFPPVRLIINNDLRKSLQSSSVVDYENIWKAEELVACTQSSSILCVVGEKSSFSVYFNRNFLSFLQLSCEVEKKKFKTFSFHVEFPSSDSGISYSCLGFILNINSI